MNINKLSSKIIGAAIELHKALGPGLLESTGWVFLLFGLSAKSKKKITLCDLCVFAVNYYNHNNR